MRRVDGAKVTRLTLGDLALRRTRGAEPAQRVRVARRDADEKAEKLERGGRIGGGTAERTGAGRQTATALGEQAGDEVPGRMEEVLRREKPDGCVSAGSPEQGCRRRRRQEYRRPKASDQSGRGSGRRGLEEERGLEPHAPSRTGQTIESDGTREPSSGATQTQERLMNRPIRNRSSGGVGGRQP